MSGIEQNRSERMKHNIVIAKPMPDISHLWRLQPCPTHPFGEGTDPSDPLAEPNLMYDHRPVIDSSNIYNDN